MKKPVVGLIVLAVLVLVGVLAMRMMAPPPAELDLAREKPSAAGVFDVAIAPETEPLQQGALHGWIVTVKRPDGAIVDDAVVSVDGGMPQHGHGLPTAPQATRHLGDGRYRIEGVRFNMGGWWVLKLAITSAVGTDTADFNIVL